MRRRDVQYLLDDILLDVGLAFVEPFFFIGYLISIAIFDSIRRFMANAGGAWDNAKKVVEVDLKQKGTPLHDATVVGDTVGDPFKDTSSVALNPVIKFTTLFGLLAVELRCQSPILAVSLARGTADQPYPGGCFLLASVVFVWRSFHKMRIGIASVCRNNGGRGRTARLKSPGRNWPRMNAIGIEQ